MQVMRVGVFGAGPSELEPLVWGGGWLVVV